MRLSRFRGSATARCSRYRGCRKKEKVPYLCYFSAKVWHCGGLGKDKIRTNRAVVLTRVMPYGEVNHKINIAILKILLIKELSIFSFARLFEFTG